MFLFYMLSNIKRNINTGVIIVAVIRTMFNICSIGNFLRFILYMVLHFNLCYNNAYYHY